MAPGIDRALDRLEDISYAVDYSIVGPRDNRVHEFRTTEFPYNTVCHIERDFGDGRWRGCTGTLVAPLTVITAGHCLYNHLLGRSPVRIRVIPGRSDRDTFPYGSALAPRWHVPGRYIDARHPLHPDRRDFDYGVIRLSRPFRGIARFMGIKALSDDALRRLKHPRLVTIAGYPGDRPIGTLWKHSEHLKRVAARRLHYTVDTCPGHSGSPIWYADRRGRLIIGIHTSGMIDELGRAYGCSKGTVLAPPGMLNSGVRVTPDVAADIGDPERAVSGRRSMVRFP